MFLNLKAPISNRESKSIDRISNTRFLITFLSSIVLLMNSIVGYAQGENWRKITEMPKPRWGSGSCVLDGKIYVVGGCYTTESSPGKPAYHTVAMVNSFDPETGVWDTLAPLEVPRCYLQALVVNGKIYAIGGSVNIFGESSSTVEVYDIENDRWERSDDMPAKRLIFGACVLDNQIYVMGGVQSFATVNNPLKSMDRYDPTTGIWETCADMSRAASGLTVTSYKGKIYAIGGGVVGNGMDIVEEYDPAEDVWIRKTSMSAGRIFPCSEIVNDRIYVMGGTSKTYPPYYPSTEICTPLTDTWVMAAGEDFLPLKSTEFSCVALDKKLYAFGGAFGSPIHWSDPDVIEFDFPVVRSRSGSWLTSTDSLLVEFYEDGTLFIVPKGTPPSKDSIIKYQIGALDGVANQYINIQLDTVPSGNYEIFAIASDGRLDRGSSRFNVDMVEIADINFLNALIERGVDTNADSLISYFEAEAKTDLSLQGKSIANLKGIEAFTNLENLDCSENSIQSLTVASLSKLKDLRCDENQLRSLDVSNNLNLEQLTCEGNQLPRLDLTKNLNLNFLRCAKNMFSSLDLSNNLNLAYVRCTNNYLTSLEVPHDSNLRIILCSDNRLTNLDVSDNPQLTGFHCRGNQLTSLDISNCLSLRELDCSENQIISLDVSNLPELTQLECAENQLESLDVSTNLNLEFLACSDNQLDNLDISNNPHLMVLSCSENQLDSLDVSNNPQLGGLWCRGNQISSLDLSNNSQLFELFWQDFFFMLFGLRPELDISDMPTLYKVCVDSVPFPPPEYDSLLISNGSPNVHFTTNCSLDFEPPVISSAIVYTDTITVISSEDGVIYLVPADTEKDLRILREVCMDSVETLDMAGSIHLEGIGNDTYWLYARDTSYNISEPKALTITGVGFDQFMARQVRIYPNPVNDLITIQTCQPGSYIFEVTSVNGQLVRNGIFTGSSQQVDLSTLHKGIYFVTIKSSAYVVTRKVIVQ